MTAARLGLLLALLLSPPFPVHGELGLGPPGNPLAKHHLESLFKRPNPD